EYKYIPQV
ncbi:hypothetical protein CP8484711_1279B, partial [Chlamydia psittaci 84-8471/1]